MSWYLGHDKAVTDSDCIFIGMIPIFIAMFLFILSLIPISGMGWIYGVTTLKVDHCEAVRSCVNGTVTFQVQVNPFYAASVFTTASRGVQSVAWTDLNTRDLCQNTNSSLHTQYAVPNNFCNSNNEFVFPSIVQVVQAMVVLTCIFGLTQMLFGCCAVRYKKKPLILMYYGLNLLTLIFASVALAQWNDFTVTRTYRDRTATVFPVWNATVVFLGQVLVKGKYSSHWEDEYTIAYSDQLRGAQAYGTVLSSGWSMWLSGVVFTALTMLTSMFGLYAIFKPSHDDSFGSGVYVPQAAPVDPSSSLPSAAADYQALPPPAYVPPADVARPSQPPPPPPDADLYALKKEW